MTLEEWKKELEAHYNGWEDQADAKAILRDWEEDQKHIKGLEQILNIFMDSHQKLYEDVNNFYDEHDDLSSS